MNEPAPTAKVNLITARGAITIELWAAQAPNATRAFLAHCAAGDYASARFDKVTQGYIQAMPAAGPGELRAQLPPLAHEHNSRLRFGRRGIVAYVTQAGADVGQFLVSLTALPLLQGKHTIIGRVVGDSVYILESIAAAARDGETPLHPTIISQADIVVPYFDLGDWTAQKKPIERPDHEAPLFKRARPRQLRIYDDAEIGSAVPVRRIRPDPSVAVQLKPKETGSEPTLAKRARLVAAEPEAASVMTLTPEKTLERLVAFQKRYIPRARTGGDL